MINSFLLWRFADKVNGSNVKWAHGECFRIIFSLEQRLVLYVKHLNKRAYKIINFHSHVIECDIL